MPEVDTLRRELLELAEERREVQGRLRDLSGRSGRGRGGFRGGGRGGPWQARGGHEPGNRRPLHDDAAEEPSSKRVRLQSSVVVLAGEDAARERHAPPAVREEPTPAPRPVQAEGNTAVRRRDQRLFGALLMGTLQKFKKEEDTQDRQSLSEKRREALQKAEQREREESQRLRQQERSELAGKKREELLVAIKLAAKEQEVFAELRHAMALEHEGKLASFLKTQTEPAVLFLPATLCDATTALMEERQRELESTKAAKAQALQEEKGRIAAHAAEREAGLSERWQTRGTDAGVVLEGAAEAAPIEVEEGEMVDGAEGERRGQGGRVPSAVHVPAAEEEEAAGDEIAAGMVLDDDDDDATLDDVL